MDRDKIFDSINKLNFDEIEVDINRISCDSVKPKSYIGEEFMGLPTYLDFTKDFRRKVGDKFRFGKYVAVVISDDYPNLLPPRYKIIREINIIEKIYHKYTFKIKLVFEETIYSISRLNKTTFNNRKPKGIKEWIYILNHKYKEIRFNVGNKRQW